MPESPRLRLNDVTDRSVDGVVMASMSDAEFVREVYEAGIPCVEIGSGYGPHLIHPDNEGGADAAVSHLVEMGHRRIVHWRGAGDNYAAVHRCHGFQNAAARFRLKQTEALVLTKREEVAAELNRSAARRPTAIFAYNDYQATLVLDMAREIGLSVPSELSVVGFDDNILAEAARPQLTTVRNSLGQQADTAINLLQALWAGQEEPEFAAAVPTHLIVRHSTARAPNHGKTVETI
jgi:DNA-binding LacI/PurR family transcriptional regulator